MTRRAVQLAGLAALALFAATGALAETKGERVLTGVLQSTTGRALLLQDGAITYEPGNCITLVVPARLRGSLEFFDGALVEASGEYDGNGAAGDAPGEPLVMHQRYEGWPVEDWCQGKFLFVTAMKKASGKS